MLEFRIAAVSPQTADASRGGAEPNITDEQVARYREQMQEKGPRSGLDEPWRWFEIGSLERYIDEEVQREAVQENAAAALASFRGVVGTEYRGKYYLLLGNEPTTAMMQDQEWQLDRAYRTTDELGTPAVGFNMGPRGADALARITRPNVKRPMAILLDGGVINTPTLQQPLSNRGIITGQFSPEYVDFLVRTLNSGSLDAQLGDYPILIKTTGPQLGADNLRSGVTAAVLALVIVAIFMVFYYFFAGLVATIALAANMVIILGIMAMIQATFTLPGIAGIVLTIGMAVDANVLIFERIREETRDGADLGTAIRLGFDKALSTIVDANLTTFITAVVLFYTATAEIKGFATTLMCGILATMFTSLILSRVLIDAYHRLLKAKSLPMLPTAVPAVGRALSPNVNWISKRYGFFTISILLMGAGIGMVFARGENMLDIEFRSGTQVTFNVDYDLEGREVTPPDAIDRDVPEGVESPLVPIEEVRARLQLLARRGGRRGLPRRCRSHPETPRRVRSAQVAMENYRERYAAEQAALRGNRRPRGRPRRSGRSRLSSPTRRS